MQSQCFFGGTISNYSLFHVLFMPLFMSFSCPFHVPFHAPFHVFFMSFCFYLIMLFTTYYDNTSYNQSSLSIYPIFPIYPIYPVYPIYPIYPIYLGVLPLHLRLPSRPRGRQWRLSRQIYYWFRPVRHGLYGGPRGHQLYLSICRSLADGEVRYQARGDW